MATQQSFEVEVERDGKWWVFTVPALGPGAVGQALRLAEVNDEAQGVAAAWLDVPPDTVSVNVTLKGYEQTLAAWAAAEAEEAEARQAQKRAAERRREVVHTLRAQGLTAPDTGKLLGITKQRVFQLEHSA